MPLLDAALAFALTMLLISTTVTFAVGGLHLLLSTRYKVLRDFLGDYYKDELVPTLEAELARMGDRLDEGARTRVLESARWLSSFLTSRGGGLPPRVGEEEHFVDEVQRRKLVDVPTAEMRRRLEDSWLGVELASIGSEGTALLERLTERYDAVGSRVSLSFRVSARRWSTLVALAMAFGLNIDSLHLLTTYINDDASRAAVVARADAAVSRHEEALAYGDEDATTREALSSLRTDLQQLQGAGLPMGWGFYPRCAPGVPDPRCRKASAYMDADGPRGEGLVMWVLGCLLTAMLAGLGAPFWYDAVRRVAKVATAGAPEPAGSSSPPRR